MSVAIRPEVRVFIDQLRAGKSCDDAMLSYCWAKSALPVLEEQWQDGHHKSVAWGASMADAAGWDKFEEGGTDAEIAEAFQAGLAEDRGRGILWRAMEKDERPTAPDLLRAMSLDDKVTAGTILGFGFVARAIA